MADGGNEGTLNRSANSASLAAGKYAYRAVVASNDNYTGATSDCEPFTVVKAPLTITTEVHNAAHADITNSTTVPLGSIVHDTANVTGGVSGFALPAVSFTLTTGYIDTCASGVAVADGGNEGTLNRSADSSPLAAGTYAYRATVAGNDNYIGDISPCEPFTVSTIIIRKLSSGGMGTFDYAATGSGLSNFSITTVDAGSGNGAGEEKFHPLQAGTLGGSRTVTELTPPSGWFFTGLACTSQLGTSTFSVDQGTRTATISNLVGGDVVTCTYDNTAALTTRTQGFFATHMVLTNVIWFGGSAGGHTFPGLSVADQTLCDGFYLNDIGKVLGGFWANIAKESDKDKRSKLDQARMQLSQQLLAAILNNAAFGSSPSGAVSIEDAKDAFCCGTLTEVKTAASAMAQFNESGDTGEFTPGVSANGKEAKDAANIPYWDTLPSCP